LQVQSLTSTAFNDLILEGVNPRLPENNNLLVVLQAARLQISIILGIA